ncbi:MAG: serine/threonine-protein kinase [Acidobacteriota bacterium]
MTRTCPRCRASYTDFGIEVCPACLFEAEVPPVVLGGSLELLDEIGRGGMGTVYRARHQRLQRDVAVKLLPEHLAGEPEFRARFEREARALALLDHPSIVRVHDFGQEENQSYLVMELVDGRPLSDRIPLHPVDAVPLLLQVCDALAYAHGRGVIHRDVKPANILVTDDGRVKVTDFGIARIVKPGAAGMTVTATHQVLGTPSYMAPEAMAGAPPDPRSDVYSLGVVLYQTLTGQLPVGSFDPAPPPFDPIVRKALASRPERRHAAVADLRAEIEAAMATIPFSLRAASRPPAPGAPAAAGPAELPRDERLWVGIVAALFSVASFTFLYGVLTSLTPRIVTPSELDPLMAVSKEVLPDGRIVSWARFEIWKMLGAVVAFAAAVAGYGVLRSHWKRTGLMTVVADRRVPGGAQMLVIGLACTAGYGLRFLLQAFGRTGARPYFNVAGGLLIILGFAFLWASILEAWRTSRPLSRALAIWGGLGLMLFPVVCQLVIYVTRWTP